MHRRWLIEQVLDELVILLRCKRRRTDSRSHHGHGREATFQRFDIGVVLAIGHQLTLLPDEGVPIPLLGIDLHQLQAQVTALGLLCDSHFQKVGGLIETTTINTALGLSQDIIGLLLGNRGRLRCGPYEDRLGLRLGRWRPSSL
ncbi:hypothetical protein D3C76_1167470 [compost metagenome]